MERISGPYKGYFIAAYTVASSRTFTGYAKICVGAPADVWNAESVERLACVMGLRTEAEALAAAEQKARRTVADMVGEPTTMPSPLE